MATLVTSISGLQNLPALDSFTAFYNNELHSIDLSGLNSLTQANLSYDSQLQSVTLNNRNLRTLYLQNTGLPQSQVDSILASFVAKNLHNGFVNLSGGSTAAPSQNGLTSKATLEGRGWEVLVNEAAPGNVGIPASTDFDIVGDFTIEMFVNMSNLDGFPRPYSFGAYPAPNAMSIEGGQLYFWANNSNLVNGTFEPNIGQWYHICVMGSGSTVYMYIDGFNVASSPYGGAISSQGLPLTIGYGNESNSGFNGKMSDFRWTSSALYNTSGFDVPTSHLPNVGGCKLLIFQGTNLPMQLSDLSGNGHNATNAGATYSGSTALPSETGGSLQMGTV